MVHGKIYPRICVLILFILVIVNSFNRFYFFQYFQFLYILFRRTPFEVNDTLRRTLLVLYGTFGATCATLFFCSMPSLLIGFMLYLEAIFLDIKSLFSQLDHLSDIENAQRSKQNNSKQTQHDNFERKLFECCKEVVDLHQKMNRYCLSQSTNPLNSSYFSRFRFLHCTAKVLNAVILMTVTLYAMCICTSLLIIEKVIKNHLILIP